MHMFMYVCKKHRWSVHVTRMGDMGLHQFVERGCCMMDVGD
jgi:hypothetical protein